MRLRFAIAALLIAAGALGAPASAREPGAEVVAFGRYEAKLTGKKHKAERTVVGFVLPSSGYRLLERTDVIAGQLGNDFGMELRFHGFPPGDAALTIRTLHPPITNPETGQTSTSSEYDWTVATDRSFHLSFYFGRRWLIAEGPWTMQVLYRGRIIAEKTFTVVVAIN